MPCHEKMNHPEVHEKEQLNGFIRTMQVHSDLVDPNWMRTMVKYEPPLFYWLEFQGKDNIFQGVFWFHVTNLSGKKFGRQSVLKLPLVHLDD